MIPPTCRSSEPPHNAEFTGQPMLSFAHLANSYPARSSLLRIALALVLFVCSAAPAMEWVQIDRGGKAFVLSGSGSGFRAPGV